MNMWGHLGALRSVAGAGTAPNFRSRPRSQPHPMPPPPHTPQDRREKESFFNWFYLAINVGSLIACTVIVYIQDQVSWTLGFAVPGAHTAPARPVPDPDPDPYLVLVVAVPRAREAAVSCPQHDTVLPLSFTSRCTAPCWNVRLSAAVLKLAWHRTVRTVMPLWHGCLLHTTRSHTGGTPTCHPLDAAPAPAAVAMACAVMLFLAGRRVYRHVVPIESPMERVVRVVGAALHNRWE